MISSAAALLINWSTRRTEFAHRMKRGGDLHVSGARRTPAGLMRQAMGRRDDDSGAGAYDDNSAMLGMGWRAVRRAYRGRIHHMAWIVLRNEKWTKKYRQLRALWI